jgi:hypothetical protein
MQTIPVEPRAYDLLDSSVRVRFYNKMRRLRAHWPRLCACGAEFRGPQARTAQCPTCRAAAKRVAR